MKNNDAFLYKNLTAYDQILFARAFQTALEHFGKESCWCLTKMNNAGFKGFTTSKKTKLMYIVKNFWYLGVQRLPLL